MIEVKFSGETAEDVKEQIAAFLGAEGSAPAKTTATRTRAKKAAATDEDEDEPKKKVAAKKEGVTIDDVREAMSAKTEEDEDNADLIKKLLSKYDAKKLSEVDEDDFEALLKAINKL